jgi:hypothetical protein
MEEVRPFDLHLGLPYLALAESLWHSQVGLSRTSTLGSIKKDRSPHGMASSQPVSLLETGLRNLAEQISDHA